MTTLTDKELDQYLRIVGSHKITGIWAYIKSDMVKEKIDSMRERIAELESRVEETTNYSDYDDPGLACEHGYHPAIQCPDCDEG